MRLQIVHSKNAQSFYVVKSILINGKRSSKVVEKLGTYADLLKRSNGEDPVTWAQAYVATLTRAEKDGRRAVLVKYEPSKQIPKDELRSVNGGYLFLQALYHELGLHTLCATITEKYKFDYDLNAILSRLVYSRILYPAS